MKQLLIFSLSVLVFNVVSAQNGKLEGTWLGTVNVGVKLRLVFHFAKDPSGTYTATMDSPDQNAKGLPVKQVSFTNDSVHVDIAMPKATFKGKLLNDSTLDGSFTQGPASLPLLLKKTEGIKGPTRPQTPKPPFNYQVEEVEFDNGNKTVHLGATLTMPNTGENFPAVILISGSGQQDRDGTILNHKPFAIIADYLTKMGFAVLRVDDRKTGKSKGDLENATSKDFADDVQTSLQWLRSRPEINKNKIGLIGHSEGGLIALMVAAADKNIDFVVSLAGPGTRGVELMAAQNEAILAKQGVSAEAAKAYRDFFAAIANVIIADNDTTAVLSAANKLYNEWRQKQPQQILLALNMQSEKQSNEIVYALFKAFRQPWMKYFLESDAGQYAKQTDAKILALFGAADVQVLPEQNSNALKEILKKRKSKNFTVQILPGLNHLFQTCTTCKPDEYGELEESFSPTALNVIGTWLQDNILKK